MVQSPLPNQINYLLKNNKYGVLKAKGISSPSLKQSPQKRKAKYCPKNLRSNK
jgi:hypothetical protein